MIKIFVTGGTFDKDYDEKKGRLYFKKTHMNEILALGRSKVEVNIETLMMLDSLDMKEEDRELIVAACTAINEDQIVITHGTDTMTKTAKALGGNNLKKTIGFDIQNTSIVNFLSSFFLGILVALNFINNELLVLFYSGFLGCFSTFSSFIYQLFILFKKRKFLRLFFHYIEVIIISFLFFYLGYFLIKFF